MVYNKEPIQVLWELTKDLRSDTLKIFRETMHEEKDNVPNSYIVLRSQMSDTTETYGDGKSLIRSADCDIILVTKGYADDSTDLHNINKRLIRQQLRNKEINFSEFNLGYDEGLKSTQHTFSLAVNYIG